MKIDMLIYLYMAVCASMILFNCVTILVNKKEAQKIIWRNSRLEPHIRAAVQGIQEGEPLKEKHHRWMAGKLKHIGNLMAFDDIIERIGAENEGEAEEYLKAMYPVFVELARYYSGKDSVQTTCFVWFLHRHEIVSLGGFQALSGFLFQQIELPNMYCRENALQIIYQAGSPADVVKALKIMDEHQVFHHAKLIHDGLLEFAGEKEELVTALWDAFAGFSVSMKVTLLQYMRFSTGSCCAKVMETLNKKKEDDEVKFACMRYFGRYYYEPAYPFLISCVQREKEHRWEYAAIAATALHNYRAERTIEVLVDALHSTNWYVRNNAAASLESMGMTYVDLVEIFDGNDRYAREILQYWLDYRAVKEEEERYL